LRKAEERIGEKTEEKPDVSRFLAISRKNEAQRT
jgi:hypothetical protein